MFPSFTPRHPNAFQFYFSGFSPLLKTEIVVKKNSAHVKSLKTTHLPTWDIKVTEVSQNQSAHPPRLACIDNKHKYIKLKLKS